MKFIQFIGTQRSGSNLLRTMLNQLPEIAAPHPPHILQTFHGLLPGYGDLKEEKSFSLLVEDVCSWVEANPVRWQPGIFDRDEIQLRCRENSLTELFYQIYTWYAEQKGSSYACCKSMCNVHYYKDLENAGIAPYYILLHRDGRDVACSFKKAFVGEKHIYPIARQWKRDQDKSLELEQSLSSDRLINIRYRDLITDTESVLKGICAFLDVPYQRIMLDYFHAEESLNTARSGKMWQNLSRPVMAKNYDKFLQELTPEEICLFEHVAGDTLQKFGYTLTSGRRNGTGISQQDIDAYTLQNSILKQEALLQADPHDIAIRRPQKELFEQLQGKLLNTTLESNRLTGRGQDDI